jgi:hypothetical protein
MTRTIKLSYDSGHEFGVVLADLRRRQGRLVRSAYRRLAGGTAQRDLYKALRSHPVGHGLKTWLVLSGMKRASALHSRFPDGGMVFAGKRALIARSQGRMDREEWKAARLMSLYIEGHAKSFGAQGGNHLVTLDLGADQVIFHGPDARDYPLQLRLSQKSHGYRRRLGDLQARCETVKDTPFTVSITEQHISITWKDSAVPIVAGIPGRVLALDLNPSRLGWAVVESESSNAGSCRCRAWGVFEFSALCHLQGLASDDPRSMAFTCKRRHELALIAKKVSLLAAHHQVSCVLTERLKIAPQDHGKGRAFNRLINRVWFRHGFLGPFRRRLDSLGIAYAEVNPAFSSKIGNALWADLLRIPDPACAAVEIGRRWIHAVNFPAPQKDLKKSPMPNVRRPRKDDARVRPRKGPALGGWTRVWSQLQLKVADTRRRSRADLRPLLPPGNPRLAPLVNPRSKVLRYELREGTSPPFGNRLHALCRQVEAEGG